MHIAIVEDDLSDYEYVKQLVKEICFKHNYHAITFDFFNDVSSFKQKYIPKSYDLIFLDCYLKNHQLGIDAGKYIRSYADDVPIIFTSSYNDFAIEGYEIKAIGYLLKPISKEKLKTLITDLFFMPTLIQIELDNKKIYTLDIDNLVCCQSDRHYVNLLMHNNKSLRLRITFIHLFEQIKHIPQLYNCSRGYIINLNYVDSLNNKSFILINGMNIPISRQLYNKAKETYHHFLLTKLRK
ncbi:MAG: LytTR family DNA-binding domain-containing protein [Thomasclavelia sp.]|nr:LytTR family DNA-binding domain-containing protein [Thomasclavelia sp.]